MHRIYHSILVSLALITILGGVAHATITRTLRLGMRGPDVRELQVFLNSDPQTRIAESGSGAPEYESEYFGKRTMLAVKRFQEKYRNDILAPVGLQFPTGVVGLRTRLKIAQLRTTPPVGITTPSLSSVPVSLTPATPSVPVVMVVPRITAITPAVVTTDNQQITLHGSFDLLGNTVILSSEAESGVYSTTAPDGKSVSFSFSFSLARKLREQLAGSANYAATVKAVVENLSGPEIEKRDGKTYSRVILVVKNQYGQSSPQTLYVDLAAVLTS